MNCQKVRLPAQKPSKIKVWDGKSGLLDGKACALWCSLQMPFPSNKSTEAHN